MKAPHCLETSGTAWCHSPEDLHPHLSLGNLDDWLTVHRSITLVNFQLDTQNSLFIYIQYIY